MFIFFNRPFVKKYAWVAIPAFPLFFFLFATIFIFFSPQQDKKSPTDVTPSQTTTPPTPTPHEDFDSPYQTEGLTKKETFSDGTVLYGYPSSLEGRENLKIIKPNPGGEAEGEDDILFERAVPPDITSTDDFISVHGQPELLLTGSTFYGPGVQIYVYARPDFAQAYIVQTRTNVVLEELSATTADENDNPVGMTLDEFLTKYKKYFD